MDKTLRGKVWLLGKNVDTDAIVSGQYLDAPEAEIALHVFENILPEFPSGVKKGDVIIAGANFGCGSSREQAPVALKYTGICCVVAESFGRIFFRNSIAIGLPVLTCKGIAGYFETGEMASISFDEFVIENINRDIRLRCDPLSDEMRAILDKNGILEYLKEFIQKK